MDVDPAKLLDLAVRAARLAGSQLADGREARDPEVLGTKSSSTDVVTAMDTAAERTVVETLRAQRPDDAILAEEGGASGEAAGSGVRWVIDPLDGTTNYLYDLPDWAVSIAAEWGGTPVAAVVHVVPRGETFTAIRGRGAECNGEALACGGAVQLERALVATGFDYDRTFRGHQGDVVRGLLPAVRDIRRSGCCSADLCSVAAGRVDAFYERARQPWDIAAGSLVAEEAGARVRGVEGAPPDTRLLLAAEPALFEAMHDLLLTLDPELSE